MVPKPIITIEADCIDMTAAPDMNKAFFWEHHLNTKDTYLKLANGIDSVRQAMENGMTDDEIKAVPELRDTFLAYFEPEKMIKVNRESDGHFSYAGDGRHRIAAAKELGLSIPVMIIDKNCPEDSTIAQTNVEPEPGNINVLSKAIGRIRKWLF